MKTVNLEKVRLSVGQHKASKTPEDGACIMELVSYMANEPWSDAPQCASASITSFCIWINDKGDQKHRDILLTLAPKIVNTRDFKKEPARADIFADFALWCSEEAKKHAEYAVNSAAEYAEYAKYAAEYAKYAAEYAAEYAKYAAEYAKYAAEYAAEYAESAEYAKFREMLYTKAIETLKLALDV